MRLVEAFFMSVSGARHERWLAKLAELARESEEKSSREELVQSRLRREDWETLRKEAVEFAEKEIFSRKCVVTETGSYRRGMRRVGGIPGLLFLRSTSSQAASNSSPAALLEAIC